MSATNYAAWWGAVVATLTLALNLLRWRSSRPRLIVDVESLSNGLVSARITNTGEQDTDLVAGYFVLYEGRLARIRGHASARIDLNDSRAIGSDRLEGRVRAHGSWKGRFFTEDWVTNHESGAIVLLHLYEASRPDKPYLVRVPRLMELEELAKAVLKGK